MKSLLCGLLLSGLAGSAYAVPIPFSFDGGSLDATGDISLGAYLAGSGSAVLDDGESENFNFGTVGLLGAFGSGTLTLTVNFIDPTAQQVGVSGPYSVSVLITLLNESSWAGGSSDFNYTFGGYAGAARMTLTPISESCNVFQGDHWPCSSHFQFLGSITNLGSVAVAEPATLGLLGLGLLGIGIAGRRRRGAE